MITRTRPTDSNAAGRLGRIVMGVALAGAVAASLALIASLRAPAITGPGALLRAAALAGIGMAAVTLFDRVAPRRPEGKIVRSQAEVKECGQ